jgi:hypothetical protein
LTGVAVNVTDVPAHIVPVGLATIVTPGVTLALTVMVTGALVAVGEAVQVALEVITTVTTSPFVRVVEVKVGLSVPVFTPLTLHWYDGAAPPFVGVAVKVTLAPEQIEVWLATTDTDGVTLAFTDIVTGALVAVGEVVHAALEVITTVTTSPFVSVVEVKVGLFVPAFAPLTCH